MPTIDNTRTAPAYRPAMTGDTEVTDMGGNGLKPAPAARSRRSREKAAGRSGKKAPEASTGEAFRSFVEIGEMLMAAGRAEEATAPLEQAVSLSPESEGVWMELASAYNSGGSSDKAIECLIRGHEANPDSYRILVRMAVLYRESGQLVESARAWTLAAGTAGENPEIWRQLGIACDEAFLYEAAEKSLQKALELKPDAMETIQMLAQVCLHKDDPLHAMYWSRQGLKLEPDSVELLLILSVSLCQDGCLDLAKKILLRIAELAPDSTQFFYGRGILNSRTGKNAEAIDDFRRAAELDPANGDALVSLGACLLDSGDLQEAERCILQALEVKPGWPDYLFYLALVQGMLGRFPEAGLIIETLQKAGYHRVKDLDILVRGFLELESTVL